ncbi:hypothetical protein MKW98_014844, partial [Papaver atlanticum]
MVMDMYPPGSSVRTWNCSHCNIVQLKVDKVKMIDISCTDDNDSESVSASMEDLRFDVSGRCRENKDPKDVKGHRGSGRRKISCCTVFAELFLFGIPHVDM